MVFCSTDEAVWHVPCLVVRQTGAHCAEGVASRPVARLTVRLTAEGRQELEQELARLEAELPVVSLRLGDARAGGNDPAENLDLRDAMDALALLECRIGEMRVLLASADAIYDGSSRDI